MCDFRSSDFRAACEAAERSGADTVCLADDARAGGTRNDASATGAGGAGGAHAAFLPPGMQLRGRRARVPRHPGGDAGDLENAVPGRVPAAVLGVPRAAAERGAEAAPGRAAPAAALGAVRAAAVPALPGALPAEPAALRGRAAVRDEPQLRGPHGAPAAGGPVAQRGRSDRARPVRRAPAR